MLTKYQVIVPILISSDGSIKRWATLKPTGELSHAPNFNAYQGFGGWACEWHSQELAVVAAAAYSRHAYVLEIK